MANFGIGFGKFLESLGQSGVKYGQQLSQEEKEKKEKLARAPIEKLNFERLRQEIERGRFAIDEKKNEAARKKSLQNKMKTFHKLMQDQEVILETAKEAARDAGASAGQTEIRETRRPPTLGEQVGRLPGTEFEFPTDPAIQQQVTGLRERFAESEEQKEDVSPREKLEWEKEKFEKGLTEDQIDRDLRLSNNPLQEIREKGETRKETQFHQNQLTNHVKNTKALIRTGFLVNNIDKALKETGSGGVFGEGDIKSVGFGSKSYRKWLNSDESVKVRQAVSMFFLGKIKEQSGVAVSDKEFERIENAFGLNNRSTMNAFRESIQIASNETKTQLSQFEKALSPDAKGLLKERGLFTSDQLPSEQATTTGLTDEEEEELLELEKEFGGF